MKKLAKALAVLVVATIGATALFGCADKPSGGGGAVTEASEVVTEQEWNAAFDFVMNVGTVERSTFDPSDLQVKVTRSIKFAFDKAEFYVPSTSMPDSIQGAVTIPEIRELVVEESGALYRIGKNQNGEWVKYQTGADPVNPFSMSIKQIFGTHSYGVGLDTYMEKCLFSDYAYENGLYCKSGVLGQVQGAEIPAIQYKIEITFKNKKLDKLKIINKSVPSTSPASLIAEVAFDYAKPTINVPTDWVWADEA